MKREILLGVNIDHIATLRQARGEKYPDPVAGALTAELAGADGITLHLREDRRHIQDHDVVILREKLQTRMNLELAVTDDMIAFAQKIKPQHVCFVPEKRQEITTEGGLDVIGNLAKITSAVAALAEYGIQVSLFIDANKKQIAAAAKTKAPVIEIHTGEYANALTPEQQLQHLNDIQAAAKLASDQGLIVNAGHGLHYHNVKPIAAIAEMNELNIGHAIIAHAVFVGLPQAVKEMLQLMHEARHNKE